MVSIVTVRRIGEAPDYPTPAPPSWCAACMSWVGSPTSSTISSLWKRSTAIPSSTVSAWGHTHEEESESMGIRSPDQSESEA
jgi:hypothetical protein